MTGTAAIRTILADNAEIIALCGNRVYPDYLAEDTQMPAIALWTVTGTAYDCMNGGLGFMRDRVRVEAFANTRGLADQIWLICNKALTQNPVRGNFGGVQVSAITQANGPHHLADRPYDGTDKWLYRTIQSFDISYYIY